MFLCNVSPGCFMQGSMYECEGEVGARQARYKSVYICLDLEIGISEMETSHLRKPSPDVGQVAAGCTKILPAAVSPHSTATVVVTPLPPSGYKT